MRQQVDVAVLHQFINREWFTNSLSRVRNELHRVTFHDLNWEAQDLVTPGNETFVQERAQVATVAYLNDPTHRAECVNLRSDLLLQAAVRLRRYDVLLLPVSVQTLAWTRRLLSCSTRTSNIPVIGVFDHIQSAGMVDLLELGMADFVQTPLDTQELRARILCAVNRAPVRRVLQDSAPKPCDKVASSKSSQRFVSFRIANGKPIHFKDAKSALITEFEREYISDALNMERGNVARAAAVSGKNRRAFWEIMRKHQISADSYREAQSSV